MAMNIVHRRARLEDAKRLFEVRRRSISELAPKGMPIEEAAAWAETLTLAGMERKLHELEIWVAEGTEAVVAWAGIFGDRLEGLYTAPEFAGRGIGTELLDFIERLMRGRRIPAVHAQASSNSEAFYFRRGYERSGPRTSQGTQPLRKRL